MNYMSLITAFLLFAAIGGILGLVLAIASKIFAVQTDERAEEIAALLPGANCGGCGYAGCFALAQAIVDGKAKTNACAGCSLENIKKISDIMGVAAEAPVRMRAQVMCSGTSEFARKKYIYSGAHDCAAAERLGGGDKLCPNGCIGLGTCVSKCRFGAISVVNGVAVVDFDKCVGCGACVAACPKQIIKLIPFYSAHWVGCMSVDVGSVTRKYCDVGCISCKLCQKNCQGGAISVNNFVASIDYSKCIDCGNCVDKCPRMIVWSGKTQEDMGLVILNERLEAKKAELNEKDLKDVI